MAKSKLVQVSNQIINIVKVNNVKKSRYLIKVYLCCWDLVGSENFCLRWHGDLVDDFTKFSFFHSFVCFRFFRIVRGCWLTNASSIINKFKFSF